MWTHIARVIYSTLKISAEDRSLVFFFFNTSDETCTRIFLFKSELPIDINFRKLNFHCHQLREHGLFSY